jgi:glycosyltransferase involved in cell wall biosynthesis
MPIYNGAAFLEASLDSLLSQTFRDFEIVISDNGSDDGTSEICRRYAAMDHRIRYVRHEVNRGAAWNHNFVIAEARGRFFRWHHADDLCEPRHLERCVAALVAEPEVVLAYPQTMLIDAIGKVTSHYDDRLELREETPHGRLRHLLSNITFCNPVLGLIRTESLRRTALHGSYVRSDHVLLAELAMAGRWTEVPEALFRRRIHAGKSTEAHRSLRDLAAWLDPQARLGFLFWPHLRLYLEHLRAVGGANLGLRERLLCGWFVTVWHVAREVRRSRARASRLGRRLAAWVGIETGTGESIADGGATRPVSRSKTVALENPQPTAPPSTEHQRSKANAES